MAHRDHLYDRPAGHADDLELPEAPSSAAYYAGERDHLRPARILAEATTRAAAGAHA